MKKTRANYVTMVWQYKNRREALRQQYPLSKTFPTKRPEEYKRKAWRLDRKIKIWQKQIRNMDVVQNKIIALGNAIAYFTGCNVKSSGGTQGVKRMLLARSLFFKWGLENGIEGTSLMKYTGDTSVNTAARLRYSFTQSFGEGKENKDTWERFKIYIKDLSERDKGE